MSEGKAARSMMRRAGELEMLPRRAMRRPAWSESVCECYVGVLKRRESGDNLD